MPRVYVVSRGEKGQGGEVEKVYDKLKSARDYIRDVYSEWEGQTPNERQNFGGDWVDITSYPVE